MLVARCGSVPCGIDSVWIRIHTDRCLEILIHGGAGEDTHRVGVDAGLQRGDSVSASVEFAEIAISSGYATAAKCDSLDGFEKAYSAALSADGPHLIHMRIQPGSLKELGRPTVKPPEVARRFKAFLAG
ncbi:MAG: hypothetical protein EBU57_12320 [Alphaproteobacteria bacterium]|nr:hypothetical protein [Alphaproteobacteria bacterium]